jgi:hypothetical protein
MIFNLVSPEDRLVDRCCPLDGHVLTAVDALPTHPAEAVKWKSADSDKQEALWCIHTHTFGPAASRRFN